MATPEPYPYRKLNYPINNLEQSFTQEQKLQTRSNIGIPSSEDNEDKVLMVDNAAGELVWAEAPNGLPDIASGDEGKFLSVENGEPAWTDVDIPEQVNADWDATSGVQEILNKPNLATVATTGQYADLSGKPDIPASTSELVNDSGFITLADVPTPPAQLNADWDATSGVQEILNKPASKRVYAGNNITITEDADGFTISSQSESQVNADWDSASGASEILNKPDLSIYAEKSDLATVATTGSYDDLVDKPSIPSAQVNADWDATSGVSEILNRPNLATVATTGDYSDLQNLPSIPAAQVNSDWSATSGISEILNKPDLSVYATQNDLASKQDTLTAGTNVSITNNVISATDTTYTAGTGIDITSGAISVENPLPSSTSSDEGKVLKVDANGDPTWATGGGGGGGVNADWDETDPLEPSYIENKPTPKTLTAGANISISEGVGTLTISAAAGLPASTSADEGKCLVVDSNGDPEWGTGGKTYTGVDGVTVDNVNDTVGLEAPVDLVAGPGITVDNPDGNTVRISYSGYNETLLWSSSTAASSFTLSEIITNFERLKILMQYNGMNSWCDGTIVSAAQFTVACCGYANSSGDGNRLQIFGGSFTSSDGKSFASEAGKCIYFSNGNASIGGGATVACTFLKIYGVNRIAND